MVGRVTLQLNHLRAKVVKTLEGQDGILVELEVSIPNHPEGVPHDPVHLTLEEPLLLKYWCAWHELPENAPCILAETIPLLPGNCIVTAPKVDIALRVQNVAGLPLHESARTAR